MTTAVLPPGPSLLRVVQAIYLLTSDGCGAAVSNTSPPSPEYRPAP